MNILYECIGLSSANYSTLKWFNIFYEKFNLQTKSILKLQARAVIQKNLLTSCRRNWLVKTNIPQFSHYRLVHLHWFLLRDFSARATRKKTNTRITHHLLIARMNPRQPVVLRDWREREPLIKESLARDHLVSEMFENWDWKTEIIIYITKLWESLQRIINALKKKKYRFKTVQK